MFHPKLTVRSSRYSILRTRNTRIMAAKDVKQRARLGRVHNIIVTARKSIKLPSEPLSVWDEM